MISQILKAIRKANLEITGEQAKESLGKEKIYNSLEI